VIARACIAELARAHGLADIAERLAALALPSMRLVASDAAGGSSRLGGLPDLPADVSWPRARWPGYEHEPMVFCGQVALAELDATMWPGPRDGLLSFFCHRPSASYEVDSHGSARVLYIAPDTPREPRRAPDGLDDDLQSGALCVAARLEVTIPTLGVWPAAALEPLGFRDGEATREREDALHALTGQLAADQGFDEWQQHRLLGWACHIQGDVIAELSDMSEKAGMHVADWRLLLQIDSDDRLGRAFSAGALYFGIPAEDLAAHRFDRAQAVSQF
jgi:hypothetical protein